MSHIFHLGFPKERGRYAPSEHGYASIGAAIKAAPVLNDYRLSTGQQPFVVVGQLDGNELTNFIDLPRSS